MFQIGVFNPRYTIGTFSLRDPGEYLSYCQSLQKQGFSIVYDSITNSAQHKMKLQIKSE